MKALILAAGYGTRLKPYTDSLPKPLFPLAGQPVLDRTIRQLISAGCGAIIVNTHHLHDQVETYIKSQHYAIPVETRYEPVILDTGGAIQNVSDFLGNDPFMVVNSDIVTDMDYGAIYRFHQDHSCPVTLVLHDFDEFNNVTIDSEGFVLGFHMKEKPEKSVKDLAFTGVQVIDPCVIPLIPKGPSSSIDLYRKLIAGGPAVKALILKNPYWMDMGSPAKYAVAARDLTAPALFHTVFGSSSTGQVSTTHLSGDGSDRAFYRLTCQGDSMILADHGISLNAPVSEAASFEAIGRHLLAKGIPVPRIYWSDRFSGQVYLEDLGDTHLETVVKGQKGPETLALYKDALKNLALMSVKGAENFNTSWTFQTSRYDRDLIIERECLYFINAFVKGYLGLDVDADDLAEDFSCLADLALAHGCDGFMHRDFQSRNIMVRENRCYFIDFQSGRLGPVQYDLASLLIDPYTGLEPHIQDELLDYFLDSYQALQPVDRKAFLESYTYLKITRNLQMLGAFGFLSRIKGKTQFESHIPKAVSNLKRHMGQADDKLLENLKKIIEKI